MGCQQSNSAGAPAAEAAGGRGSKRPSTLRGHGSKSFPECYVLGEVLGEGAFSVVKSAVHQESRDTVAVKITNKTSISKEDDDALREEVRILKMLECQHIVKLYDFFQEPDTYMVVLEYLEGGELFDRIVSKSFYNEEEARKVMFTLLSTMKYLHDKNIVHRDLKPENLLMTTKDDSAVIKVADFGFATPVDGLNLTLGCGTPGYVAPEILNGVAYGKPVDMWAIGVIAYILLGGYPPFHDENLKRLRRIIQLGRFEFHAEYWGNVSAEAKDLIRHLLNKKVGERFTADQALNHPWIMRSKSDLASRDLGFNLKTLRRYNARRKLRAGIKAIIAANRMKNLLESFRDAKLAERAQGKVRKTNNPISPVKNKDSTGRKHR